MPHLHSIFCPVYQISSGLASGKSLTRCNENSHLGINLGISPMHAISFYLVLKKLTGTISQQFHCSFDDSFNTARISSDATNDVSNWQFFPSFRKGVFPSRTSTNILLQHFTWSDRGSYKSQDITQHLTIPDVGEKNHHATICQEINMARQSESVQENYKRVTMKGYQ